MKNLNQNSFLIIFILISFSFTIIHCFPCPSECLCKPIYSSDEAFTRMKYIIDCQNISLNNNQLIYHAESWSILEDKINDDQDDDDIVNDYIISIDLSNSLLLKEFNNQTIQLTGFSYKITSLSLTNQSNNFRLQSNSFNSSMYQNLKILNLSSCCQQIPVQCSQIFSSLNKLEILDLSASDMYTTCLNTLGAISSILRDLILRSNTYFYNTFSHTSKLFLGVQHISGKLDLQYSKFNMGNSNDGNCLFDLFTQITILDFSYIKFYSSPNNNNIPTNENYLKHFLHCKTLSNKNRNGEQIEKLYLRQLNLEYLPEWLTNEYFPQLIHLDLSLNKIYSINFEIFPKLNSISLSYNPIELENITWNSNIIYESINLRSIKNFHNKNSFENLFKNSFENLFKYSTNIDFSENILNNITKFPIDLDFNELSLNLSQTNLSLFSIEDISKFDDLYRLDISFNLLIELNLEKSSKLSYLDCSSNQYLKTLILNKDFSRLIQIKCSNNSLKTIENFSLLKHENLQLIDLSFNLINSLENIFSNLSSRYLYEINLQSNQIEKIPKNLFHNQFLSLYSINLSWNKINFIQTNSFQSPNLQILDLTGNPLKNIQPKFLFTSSLRLFYIMNNTEEFISYCAQSKSNDQLLLTYLTWFEQNGTYMKNIQSKKNDLFQFDQCLRQYSSRSKIKWMKFNENHQLKHLSFYITMFVIFMAMILGLIYAYKKNKFHSLIHFQRYRLLDRNNSIENTNEFNQYQKEDDQIVMNLDEQPFNTIQRL